MMMDLAPFESPMEHQAYCQAAGTPFEDGSIGFKIFEQNEKLGLCQLKFVGEAAYVLSVTEIDEKISKQALATCFSHVVQFLAHLGVGSVVYPIQNKTDEIVAESCGFDRVSETLFVFDFSAEEAEEHEHFCDGNCTHHHHGH